MKQYLLWLVLMLSASILFGQERIATGYVLDEDSKAAISEASVVIYDTNISTVTDERGFFSLDIPKRRRHLDIAHDNYIGKRIVLMPGFQHRPIWVYLESNESRNRKLKEKHVSDSLFLTYKNSLSLSLVELLAFAIAGRYERFLGPSHSIGAHLSVYVYGRNPLTLGSEHDYYHTYHGFKCAPAYRFYPYRKNWIAFFVEAKVPVGYIYFSKLDYHSTSYTHLDVYKKYSFWTMGYSFSLGAELPLSKKRKGIITFSFGYQYFPIDVPEYASYQVSDDVILKFPTELDWWYQVGPGARFEFKVLIGGIF